MPVGINITNCINTIPFLQLLPYNSLHLCVIKNQQRIDNFVNKNLKDPNIFNSITLRFPYFETGFKVIIIIINLIVKQNA